MKQKPNKYIVWKIRLTECELESISYLMEFLHPLGCEWNNDNLLIYFEKPISDDLFQNFINHSNKILCRQLIIEKQDLAAKDWMKNFRELFSPFEFIDGWHICPPNTNINKNKIIYINPGMGFGTGKHPTTLMCAQLINEIHNEVDSMLDVGSGSGILSIIAKKLGIKNVECVEVDDLANENAHENFQLNQIELKIHNDIKEVSKTFDLVVANIITPTLLDLKNELFKHSKKFLILSGILKGERDEILKHLTNNLTLLKTTFMDEWCTLLLLKNRS